MPLPRRWATPEDLEAEVGGYFEAEDKPTMAGLCVHLGVHRDTFNGYGRGEYDNEDVNYSAVVKAARMRVEARVEGELLYNKAGAGAIFWLKNHAEYKDVQHNENNHKIRAVLSEAPLTDEEWEQQSE